MTARARLVSLAFAAVAACGGGGSGGGPGGPTPPPPPREDPPPFSTPVSIENAQPGGTGWKLHQRAAPGVLEAYAGEPSVQHGEKLDVHVGSNVPSQVRWEAWRMGSYGGARSRPPPGVRPR